MAVFAVVVCVACEAPTIHVSSAAADAGVDAAEPPLDEVYTRVAESYCNTFESCSPVEFSAFAGDRPGCVARYARYVARLTNGWGVGATVAQRRACAEALDVKDCAKAMRLTYEPPTECRIPGELATGDPCATGIQCKNARCVGSVCGRCAALVAEGGDCPVDGACAFGLVCTNKKCRKPGDVGAACDKDKPCHRDLVCDGGACARAPIEGQACLAFADSPCGNLGNLACDTTANKCVRWKLAKRDEPCGSIGGAPVLCANGSACRAPIPTQPGVCVPGLPDGATCAGSVFAFGGPCTWPSRCMANVCRPLELVDCTLPGVPL